MVCVFSSRIGNAVWVYSKARELAKSADGWARNSGLAFQSIGKNWFIVVGHCSNWETIGVPLKSNQAKGRGVSKQRKEKLDQKKRNFWLVHFVHSLVYRST